MSDRADFLTTDIKTAVAELAAPAITIWNRLEARPRLEKFDRALKAEVRDALWMLTRQWQLGEFKGDDAGSPFASTRPVPTIPWKASTTKSSRWRRAWSGDPSTSPSTCACSWDGSG